MRIGLELSLLQIDSGYRQWYHSNNLVSRIIIYETNIQCS